MIPLVACGATGWRGGGHPEHLGTRIATEVWVLGRRCDAEAEGAPLSTVYWQRLHVVSCGGEACLSLALALSSDVLAEIVAGLAPWGVVRDVDRFGFEVGIGLWC